MEEHRQSNSWPCSKPTIGQLQASSVYQSRIVCTQYRHSDSQSTGIELLLLFAHRLLTAWHARDLLGPQSIERAAASRMCVAETQRSLFRSITGHLQPAEPFWTFYTKNTG